MDQALAQILQTGINAFRAGQLEQAWEIFNQANRQTPNQPEIIHLLGVVALQKKDFSTAITYLQSAATMQPQHTGYLNNLGLAYHGAGQFIQAVDALSKARALAPKDASIATALGMALRAVDRLVEAEQVLREAIDVSPGYAKAHNNLGNVLQDLGDIDSAIPCFEKAMALDPTYVEAQVNRGYARLFRGDLLGGFLDYEARWHLPHNPLPTLLSKLWRGESLAGKTLHIFSEQGFGDTLQFVRFVPLLKGAQISLEVPGALFRLMQQQNWPGVTVVPQGTAITADYHLPLLSLPHRLGVDRIEAIPPYLRSSGNLRSFWEQRLPTSDTAVVWASEPTNPLVHRRKSIPIGMLQKHLAPLSNTVISLQRGAPETGRNMFDAGGLVQDFADTAAILDTVDNLLTIDTAVAHLAGALGKSPSILLPFSADWRWGKQTHSAWYPNARLYRQPASGAWDVPLTQAIRDLKSNTMPEK